MLGGLHHTPLGLAFLVIGMAAAICLGLHWSRLGMRMSINADVFLSVIQKLVRGGNTDRALKLTRAAPDAPVARLAHVALESMAKPDANPSTVAEDIKFYLPRHIQAVTWMGYPVRLFGSVAAMLGAYLLMTQVHPHDSAFGPVVGITAAIVLGLFADVRMERKLRNDLDQTVAKMSALAHEPRPAA